MAPLFRADHIGSLMRPQYLLDAQAAIGAALVMHNDTSDQPADLVKNAHELEKEAIKDVVAKQVDRKITPITSGEFQRPSFVSGFFEKLEGMEIQFMYVEDFRTAHPIMIPYIKRNVPGRHQPIATGKVRWKESAYMDEWLYVQSLLPEDQWKNVKITIPSPSWSQTQLKDGKAWTSGAYTDENEYLKDVGQAVRQEILALYEAGVRFIQIDDPMFAMMVDQEYLDAQQKEGMSLDDLLSPSIIAHNTAIRDLPDDLTIAFHLCRGNIPKGERAAVGGYEGMAKRLFNELNYKRFALEYDNTDVTGTFNPLLHLPKDKVVVLGLITTKDAELEDLGTLEKQVYEAAEIIAKGQGRSRDEVVRDNLAVSPSCGFASLSMMSGTGMTEEKQWAKLGLVQQLVEKIWGRS